MPFALILEDDMTLNPNIKNVVGQHMLNLPPDWSLLYMDFSEEHFWPTDALGKSCWPIINNSDVDLFQMNGYCSSGSTRAYILSNEGAKTLLKHSLPIKANTDVFIRDMIIQNNISAYAFIPAMATAKFNLNRPTQVNNRRLIVWDENKTNVVTTWRHDSLLDCDKELCNINIV